MPEDKKSSWLSKIRVRDSEAKAANAPVAHVAQTQIVPTTRQRIVFEQSHEPSAALPGDVWVEALALPDRTVFTQATAPKEAVPGDVWVTP
jgi:hypothetical protein